MGKSENYIIYMFQCFNVSLKQMDGLGFLRGFYAIYVNLGQGHLLTLACLSSIHTFQRSSSLNLLGQSK